MSREPRDRFMAEEMRALREMPPMQLSNERLRDAILAAGLDGREVAPSARGWAWALAPLAAAVLAVVAIPRLRPMPEPMVRIGPDAVAMDVPRLTRPMPASPRELPKIAAQESPRLAAAARLPSLPLPVGRPHPARSQPERHAPVPRPTAFAKAGPEEAKNAPRSNTPKVEASALMAASVPAPPSEFEATDGSVVLLAESPDPQTGASAATEVDSSRNVSVGG